MKHVLSILVRNKPGVMSHVSGLFTRRGFNIDSIAVGVTDDPDVSIITIVLLGSEDAQIQFKGQLLKLADVLDVKELQYGSSLVRELLLIRVRATPANRVQIFNIVEVFQGTVAEITEESVLIEVHGSNRQVSSIIRMVAEFGILEMARTGQIALAYQT